MRTTLAACVLLLLIAATPAAQTPIKPDFSGQWGLVNPSDSGPNIPQTLMVRQSIETKSVRGTPIERFFRFLTVNREFKTGVRSESYEIGMGGRIVGGLDKSGAGLGPNGQSPETQVAVKWEGNRLVIETGVYSGPTRKSGPYAEHEELWSLDSEGMLHITVTDRGSGTEPKTTNLSYRRR
jgi:hypothetical protein